MPNIDKPLNELKEYLGCSPKPEDFDAFWDRSLQEMAALDSSVQWEDRPFPASYASCKSLFFKGIGGSKIHSRVALPNPLPQTPSPALLFFHGYSGSAPDWIAMLPYVAAGFTVVGMDCRGQGGLSEDTVPTTGNTLHGYIIKGLDDAPEKMYFRNVFLDTAQLARIVMGWEWVDQTRVMVAGGSQGGALALVCASLVPEIARVFPQYPFLSDFKRIWNMGWDKQAYSGMRDYLRRFDPLHEREDEFFNKLGYIDIQNLTPRIRGEVRMAMTLLDEICPPSTQFAAYNKITAKKSCMIYPDFAHEGLPGCADETFAFAMGLLEK